MRFFPIGPRRRSSLLLVLAVALAASPGCAKRETESPAKTATPASAAPASSSSSPSATTAAAASTTTPAALKKVLGRWLREDGGYVLEIKNGAPGGVLEALYFNPRSIHVERAAWYEGAGKLQVLVELNDTGYPGATYVLSYDPATDKLAGEYRQPAMQQSFQIEFIREPKQP
ncbi:MAG: hypothetical protein RLZZ15_3334 [Verrucomicrobiota bacterium]|jgi:hypothetical protein